MTRTVTRPDLGPVHPGEILVEEFLIPLGLTPYAVAARLKVPRTRIERLARRETSVTVDTACRLARLFGTSPQFWLHLQQRYDLQTGQAPEAELEAIEPIITAA